MNRDPLQLVMPVHNEGASIEATLREWHEVLSPHVDLEIIVCEDGSRDNTKEVLRRVARELPIRLDLSDTRRGYGGAMIAGLLQSSTPWVLTADSDGQADPRDFVEIWKRRHDHELLVGWRVNRADRFARKIMSGTFRTLHRVLFGTRLHDPSCNVMLFRRQVIDSLIPYMGLMSEGFQWELVARALRADVSIGEIPVRHRLRAAGGTVVYRPSRIPGIAWRNGLGLVRIWMGERELRHEALARAGRIES